MIRGTRSCGSTRCFMDGNALGTHLCVVLCAAKGEVGNGLAVCKDCRVVDLLRCNSGYGDVH